jgi:hypothetical protein
MAHGVGRRHEVEPKGHGPRDEHPWRVEVRWANGVLGSHGADLKRALQRSGRQSDLLWVGGMREATSLPFGLHRGMMISLMECGEIAASDTRGSSRGMSPSKGKHRGQARNTQDQVQGPGGTRGVDPCEEHRVACGGQ